MTSQQLDRRTVLKVSGIGLAGGILTPAATGAASVAEGSTVYVGSNDGSLYAVDAVTGDQKWAFEDLGGRVASSPTVVEGTVYVGSDGATLYAVDAATGEPEWTFEDPSGSVRSSPTVVDEVVYVGGNDATLYAVDTATGEPEWTFGSPEGGIRSSPTVADGTVYVGSADETLYAVDAVTGEPEWTFDEPEGGIGASPTVAGGTVYVGSDDATLYAVDAATGEPEWTFDEPESGIGTSPTVVDGIIYFASRASRSRVLFAVDAATGEQKWVFDDPSRPLSSSPTVAYGTVYVGGSDGSLYAINAVTGDKQWKFETGYRVQSSPTAMDGVVYFGNQDKTLFAIDAATGEREWTFRAPTDSVTSSPTVVTDPDRGDSVDSRVLLGTLGHHEERTDGAAWPTDWFEVEIEDVNTPIEVGENLDVRFHVSNRGESTAMQTIELVVHGLGSETIDIVLPDGESTTELISLATDHVGEGSFPIVDMQRAYTVRVFSDEDVDTETVTIHEESEVSQEALAIGSGGSLLVLLGAYTLMRRNREKSTPLEGAPDSETELSSDDQTPGDPSIDEYLGMIDGYLNRATATGRSQDYDRAFRSCREALDTVEDALELAREGAPERIEDIETRREEAEQLRKQLESERKVYEAAMADLEDIDEKLSEAAIAFDDELPSKTLQRFHEIAVAIRSVVDSTKDYEAIDISYEVNQRRRRYDRLYGRAEVPGHVPSLDIQLGDLKTHLDHGRQARERGGYDRALNACQQAIDAAETAHETARISDPDRIDEIEACREDAERLHEEIESERDSDDASVSEEIHKGPDRSHERTGPPQDVITILESVADDLDATEEMLSTGTPTEALQEINDVDEALQEVEDLVSEHPALADEYDHLRHRCETLQTVALARDVDSRLDEVEVRLDGVDDEIGAESTSRIRDELEEVAATLDELETSVTEGDLTAQDDLDQAGFSPANFETRIESLRETIDCRRELVESVDRLRQNLEEHRNDIAEGKTILDEEKYEEAHKRFLALQSNLDELATRADRRELDELLTEIETLRDQCKRARNQAAKQLESREDERLDEITDSLDEVAACVETDSPEVLQTMMTDVEEALDEVAAQLATASHSTADLEDRLETLYENAEHQHAVIEAAEHIRTHLEDGHNHIDVALERLESNAYDEALERIDTVEHDLDALTDPLDEYDFEVLEREVKSLRERCADVRDRVEAAKRPGPPASIPNVPTLDVTYNSLKSRELVGKGGNADVYLMETSDDNEVAIKEPRFTGTLHTETIERFMEEAETWDRLDDHDHVVGIVDYGDQPLPWIAMEYMDGGHLGERTEAVSLREALWIAVQVTDAVLHAHRRGVVHLDLKPANILFRTTVGDDWDVPKVADWGLAKMLLEHSKSIEGMTPQYAAPEQIDDDFGTADHTTDVYQLGAVFYELFTGEPPFMGEPFQVIRKVVDEEPAAPTVVEQGVPAELDEILLTALAKEKDERYEDLLYLRDELRKLYESL